MPMTTETQNAMEGAIKAAMDESRACQDAGDKPGYYACNRVVHRLWELRDKLDEETP